MKLTEIGLALGLTLGATFNANPATLTFDFEEGPTYVWEPTPGLVNLLGFDYENRTLVVDGFRFVPGSRMTLQNATDQYPTRWLGFDAAPHIPGPARVTVSNGSIFSLLSVDPVEALGEARWTLTSSKGGSYTNTFGAPATVTFSDPAYWSDVAWIMFDYPGSAGGSYGFDNLRLDVANARQLPEPGTLALLALALPGVLWLRRRK